ncbi:MAG: hypothetical protein QMD94_02875 [Candidatus Omnitrophota bacterium]|nr:hypothetical protein [Candidatus Omnitrophota bacterium]
MEQKIKFIIIGLIGFAIVCLFLFIQAQGVRQQLIKENEILIKDKTSLENSIDSLKEGIGAYEAKIRSLSEDLEEITLERDDFQNRYELTDKARQELVEKLKSAGQKTEAQAQRRHEPQQILPAVNTDAYWAEVLKAKTELEFQLPKIRKELNSLRLNNEELQRQKSGLELEIKTLQDEKGDLESQIEYNQKMLDKITQELVREKNDNIQLQGKYKAGANEKKALMRQLSILNNQKINLERKLQEAQKERAAVEGKFKEMESASSDRILQINSLNEQLDALHSSVAATVAQEAGKNEKKTPSSIELPPIVVRPQAILESKMQKESAIHGVIGRILAINKESKFVIIDLGENAGVRPGDIFGVYRNDLAIASLEATQVRKDIAACDIKKELQAVKIGDAIR